VDDNLDNIPLMTLFHIGKVFKSQKYNLKKE